jgi:16S rRNA (cytosine967-C5)-methyltransferase
MLPAARVQATIDLLEGIEKAPIPMDGVCGDYFRARRFIGSKDRADIAERVYAVMRAQGRLDWHLARTGMETPTPRARVLAHLILGEGRAREALDTLFCGGRYAPAPLSEAECARADLLRAAALDSPDMPEAVRAECPPESEAGFRRVFGVDFEPQTRAFIPAATLDLRINPRAGDREAIRAALAAEGVVSTPTPFSPLGLRVEGKAFLGKTKPFTKGWVEIQDEGSQLAALLCAAGPGMQVLDYCAGAGGKTLALAATMAVKGRIVAMDSQAQRLEKTRTRLRRAGVADIVEVRPLSDEKNRKWLRRQKGTFDAVLADVPCSGSGTWRRNPDLRWRRHGPDVETLKATQAEILDRVAHTLKPGGRLVYATCSVLAEENEDQIEAFLARTPGFFLRPLAEVWPLETPAPGPGPYLRLTPRDHNTDGFFAAVLGRQACESKPSPLQTP